MDFLGMLKDMFNGSETTKVLANNTGISTDSIGKVINTALPKLVNALTNNASTSEGAKSLFNALGQHTTQKSINEQLQSADTQDGNKIIGHILGGSADREIESIANDTDLSYRQISDLLSNVAPSILSRLSSAVKGTSSDGSSASGLLGILSAFNK